MTHVPIRTNGELRPSRLFNSMSSYVQKSMVTIIRAYIMYKPLKFFTCVGAVPFLIGTVLGIRYLILLTTINATGHIQSLILSSVLLLMGFITFIIGLMADILAKNRMILEDIQYHVRKLIMRVKRIWNWIFRRYMAKMNTKRLKYFNRKVIIMINTIQRILL